MNELGNLLFYTSTAEIPLSYLEKSIKIAISNPDRYALFISKSEKVLFREYIQHMFEDIIKVDDYGIIDYYKFLMTCYRNGDIALRYGTTFTDAELAIIYNPKEIEINNYFDIKAF